MDVAIIRRVREPFGILGNMSKHRVVWDHVPWRTTEALFQALRFAPGDSIRDAIRAESNPMRAKFVAKAHALDMVVEPMSAQDLDNMRAVLRLKLRTHADVATVLQSTAGMRIVEDCTNRQRGSGLFWGAALREGEWVGENWLGRLWEELR
jgi:predicted NAD-dependent protein-ADP-ribosyltransferase YbiA (DUF1768 family)